MKKKKTDVDQYHPLVKGDDIRVKTKTQQTHFVSVVPNANLSIMEFGMRAICKANGISIEELPPGNAILFIAADRRYMKALIANRKGYEKYPIVVAQRLPAPADSGLLVGIAKAFRSPGGISHQQRIEKVVEDYYAKGS